MSILRSIALALTLALGVVACGDDDSDAGGDEEPAAAADSTSGEQETDPHEPDPATETDAADEPPASAPAVEGYDADAADYTLEYSPIDAGTHRVTALGTPMTFTVDDSWFVNPNEPGYFALSDPSSVGPDDRDIVFMRVAALADPEAPGAPLAEQDGWPVDDLEGWLANLADGIEVSDPENVILGGRDAVRFDISVDDDFECGPEFCAGFVHNGNNGGRSLSPGITNRAFWIDEGETPILVMLGAGLQGEEFFDRAEEVLATLAFGEEQPHPLDLDRPIWEQGQPSEVPAGRADFTAAGFSFELAEDRFVNQRGSRVAGQTGSVVGVIQRTDSGIFIHMPIADLEGNPLSTADDVAEAILADPTAGAEEVEPTVESIYPVRQFTTAPNSPNDFGLKWDDTPGLEWHKGPNTTLYILDSPDGVVLVSAEARAEDTLAAAEAEAAQIIATLETIPSE